MFKKYLLLIVSLLLFLFYSCQEEEIFISEPTVEESNLTENLTNLLVNVASNDGSIDNILDNASCIELELPFTIIVNGIDLFVESHSDLQIVEAIFEASQDDEDILTIIYPVTIIFSDFSEMLINSDEELLGHTSTCDGENVIDADIECLDILYPLTFTLFDTEALTFDTSTINTDQELYTFINTLSLQIVVSLDFPIEIVLPDGNSQEIINQIELAEALEFAQDSCDEDDDNDQDDDDNIILTQEEYIALITDCPWELDTLLVDNINLEEEFEGIYLDFNENFTVSAFANNSSEIGVWSLEPEGNSFRLDIDILEFPNSWLLHTVEDEEGLILEFRNVLDVFRIVENCDFEDTDAGGAFPFNQVVEILNTCDWVLDVNQNGDFFFYDFTFAPNGSVSVINNIDGQVNNGDWLLEQNANGDFFLTISALPAPFELVNTQWEIFFLENDFIELENEDQTSWLIMNQTCPNNIDLSSVLLDNSWDITLFSEDGNNQTSIFSEFEFLFLENNHVIALENGANDSPGNYEVFNNDSNLLIDFGGAIAPLYLIEQPNWTVLDIQEDRVELVAEQQGVLYVLVFETN